MLQRETLAGVHEVTPLLRCVGDIFHCGVITEGFATRNPCSEAFFLSPSVFNITGEGNPASRDQAKTLSGLSNELLLLQFFSLVFQENANNH